MTCIERLLWRSFLFFSMWTARPLAFLIRSDRSSGMDGIRSAARSVSLMLLPVIGLTRGIAYWSLRIVPMALSEWPSLASLIMKASTSSGWYLHQFGGRLLTGRIECDFPFSCFGILLSLEHLNARYTNI